MRFNLGLFALAPSSYTAAARLAELTGFDNVLLSDSVFFPRETSTKYPYRADGSRAHLEDHPFVEPFSAIPMMAAVTEHIGFITCVLKLPIRHPILVAKQVASVAVLTNERLKFGVGTSAWPEDYEVFGVPWEGRGDRFEEAIDVIRKLTAGGYVNHRGAAYEFPDIKMAPVPTQPVPVLIGGHAKANMRRAARIADGWIAAATGGLEDWHEEAIAFIRSELQKNGRDPKDFEIHVPINITANGDWSATRESIRRLADLGVTDLRFESTGSFDIDAEQQMATLITEATCVAEEIIQKLAPAFE
jgi:probable F420-dependent oxidoreductase